MTMIPCIEVGNHSGQPPGPCAEQEIYAGSLISCKRLWLTATAICPGGILCGDYPRSQACLHVDVGLSILQALCFFAPGAICEICKHLML